MILKNLGMHLSYKYYLHFGSCVDVSVFLVKNYAIFVFPKTKSDIPIFP